MELRSVIWGVALILGFLLGTRTGTDGSAEREWRSSAGIAQRAQRPFKDSMATMRANEARLRAVMVNARARVESVMVTVSKDSIPESILLVLADQTEALDACEEGWTSCQVRAAWAEARSDSLSALLGKGLRVTKCNILFLPCPSRGLAFVGGAVAGGLLSGVLK